MAPVVDGVPCVVVAIEHALMDRDNPPARNHDKPIRIDVQANDLVGVSRWYTVAVALIGHQACRGNTLAMCHITIESRKRGPSTPYKNQPVTV